MDTSRRSPPPRRRRALTGISPWAFRVIPSDSANGLTIAQFANKLGRKRAAVLYENNPYGRGLADNFRRSFAGQIISIDPISEARRSELRAVRELVQERAARLRVRRRHGCVGPRVPQGSTPPAARPPISWAATDGRRSRRARSPRASTSVRRSARRIRGRKCSAFVAAYTRKYDTHARRQRRARIRCHEAARARGREGGRRPHEDPRLSREPLDAERLSRA